MKNRWINLLFFLVIVLISALAYRLFVLEQTREAARLLINILRPLSILLIAIVLFVILRSLVKLYFARRRRVSGYRLQTKVVLSLLPLTVLPSVALFLVSTRSLDDFFLEATATSDERAIVAISDALIRDHLDKVRRLLLVHGDALADLHRAGDQASLQAYLQRFGIDGVEVYENAALVGRMLSPDLPDSSRSRVIETATRETDGIVTHFSDGLMATRFVHITGSLELHIVDTLESDFSERYYYIRDSARFLEYDQKKTSQLQGLNQSILLVTTFTILFGGIWTALALSNRFLEAFGVFITGSRQVAAGDFDTRLSLETGDEMEDVLESFNLMTSKLKENQEELEQKARDLTSQIQYNQTILEQTSAGILSTDTAGRIESFNPAAERILDLDEIAKGDVITELLSEERHASLLRRMQQLERGETGSRGTQVELADKEGKVRHVAATIVPLQKEAVRFGNLLVLEDLTQLLEAQKLAAWREVAKRVAHEIKNPLTPIQLSIQRVMRKATRGSDDLVEAVTSAHETIMNETSLLANLVNEFSTFAKLPSPTLVETDPTELISSVQTAYAPVFPEVTLETRIAPDVPAMCRWGRRPDPPGALQSDQQCRHGFRQPRPHRDRAGGKRDEPRAQRDRRGRRHTRRRKAEGIPTLLFEIAKGNGTGTGHCQTHRRRPRRTRLHRRQPAARHPRHPDPAAMSRGCRAAEKTSRKKDFHRPICSDTIGAFGRSGRRDPRD